MKGLVGQFYVQLVIWLTMSTAKWDLKKAHFVDYSDNKWLLSY